MVVLSDFPKGPDGFPGAVVGKCPSVGSSSVSVLDSHLHIPSDPLGVLAAPFDVIGPPEPILAVVGEDAELPCRLSPNVSAEGMELRWFREKVSPAVFVSREGREQEGEEIAEYRGRVSLVEDHIAEGRVAVRIQEVKASDDGEYRCFFRQDENYEEAIVHLKVAGEWTGFDFLR